MTGGSFYLMGLELLEQQRTAGSAQIFQARCLVYLVRNLLSASDMPGFQPGGFTLEFLRP